MEKPYLCGMKKGFLPIILLLLLLSCQQLPEKVQHGDITFHPMATKRLPDLNEARSGHALVWAGDHILTIGGHTTGFIPTATAEYYEGGRWHSLPTLYPHDTPFALVLNDGDVLVGGGYENSFGVGHTWGVERYHPATHDFTPAPIMETKRAHASALELEDGSIVISGNWYTTDLTEIYDPDGSNLWTDTTSDNRSYPIILPVAKDKVWIIGGTKNSYNDSPNNIVDQLKGAPFEVDLLNEWHPQSPSDHNLNAYACRLTENTFLLPALNAEGRCASMLVDDRGFSLLPMEQPLPMESPWGAIEYFGAFWTVPETQTAWLMGRDEQKHVFLAEIGCQPALQGAKAKLTMHYSEALEPFPDIPWELMLPDGTFVTVGGTMTTNYDPTNVVFAFYPKGTPHNHTILFIIGVGLAMISLLLVILVRKRKHPKEDIPTASEDIVPPSGKSDLGDKLKALMEEKQLFRNKDLRLADVATALCSNTTYLSACLSGELKTTFPTFVTGYRIRYAQELMRNNPTMRLTRVATESGFTSEKSFLRSFKAACGMTPSEWKQEHTPQTAD